MVRRLQRLRSKRGFSLLELIIVVLIIAIMVGTVLIGTNGKREKIAEANATASDFYSAIQAEFLNFQMFDGPLTMTLNEKYGSSTIKTDLAGNGKYAGVKYYPAAGGNYPFEGGWLAGETHENGLPKTAKLYVMCRGFTGGLSRVNYSNDLDQLLGMTGTGNETAELCMVLKQEMDDRLSYKDGFYYARISYNSPDPSPSAYLTKNDYRTVGVKVDWVIFTTSPMTTDDENSYTFQSQNVLKNGKVCGVHTTSPAEFSSLGTTGTIVLNY